MKKIGIIAEYNPLHLGHIYQINKTKELYPDSIIILITNSYFTQRGEVSILTKNNKTLLALENKIDIVIELPFAYATQSADIFAKGAIKILNYLQIDTLIFGSESNDIQKITNTAKIQINNLKYNFLVKKYLKDGINYPTALNKAINDLTGNSISNPNDLLGVSYIKEIITNNYSITPISIQRIGAYHGKKIISGIANASLIRQKILNQEKISDYLPKNEEHLLIKKLSLNSYFNYLKYKILTTKNLSIYQTVEEGIENRIKKMIIKSNNWEELVQNIKTKRYTYNKINRMLIHILVDFTKQEAQQIKIDYIKILGFNDKGKKYLNSIKKNISIPIITNYKKNLSLLLHLELRAASIYYLPINPQLIDKEYKEKPIIKNFETNSLSQQHQNNLINQQINNLQFPSLPKKNNS